MLQHSETVITLPINGQDYRFSVLRARDYLATVQWANDHERSLALQIIPANSVEERLAIFNATGNRFTIHDLSIVMEDLSSLMHLLFLSYERANPGATESDFADVFGLMDVPMVDEYVNAITPTLSVPQQEDEQEDKENPPAQMTDSPGTPQSPSSASDSPE